MIIIPRNEREDAVSPVVGVMLMLVVTIIIAALVASFSGGVISSEKTAPQTTMTADYIADFADNDKTDHTYGNPAKNNGLKFRITGGDVISLKDISLQLKCGTNVITLSQNTELNETAMTDTDTKKITIMKTPQGNTTYFARLGDNDNPIVGPGESFMILADWAYDSTLATTGEKGRYLVWWPKGKTEGFEAKSQVPLEYTIMDLISNKPIQSGTITLR